jgi:hypothetical protein
MEMWDNFLDWLIAKLTGMKQLDDILKSFVKTDLQLDKFMNTAQTLVDKKAEQAYTLQAEAQMHLEDIARAANVKDQINKLLGR